MREDESLEATQSMKLKKEWSRNNDRGAMTNDEVCIGWLHENSYLVVGVMVGVGGQQFVC